MIGPALVFWAHACAVGWGRDFIGGYSLMTQPRVSYQVYLNGKLVATVKPGEWGVLEIWSNDDRWKPKKP